MTSDHLRISVLLIRSGRPVEQRDRTAGQVGRVKVVIVKQGDEFAARLSKAAVVVAHVAHVFPVPHVPDSRIGKRADDLCRAVGRGVVDNDQFEVLEGLGEDRRDGFPKQGRPVERRDTNA
jgi:hypothetical protein